MVQGSQGIQLRYRSNALGRFIIQEQTGVTSVVWHPEAVMASVTHGMAQAGKLIPTDG